MRCYVSSLSLSSSLQLSTYLLIRRLLLTIVWVCVCLSSVGRYLPYDCQLLPGSNYYKDKNNINNNININDNNNSSSHERQQQQLSGQQHQLMMMPMLHHYEGLLQDRHVLFLGDSTLLIMFKAIINKVWGRDMFLSENNSPQWQVRALFICIAVYVNLSLIM